MPGARITNGEQVTLRTVVSQDISFLQRAFANPELRQPMGFPVLNQEQIDIPTEKQDGDQFLICLDEDGASRGQPAEEAVERIGAVYVDDVDWRRPNLRFWLLPAFHGESYGSEAVSLTIEYVFRTYSHPAVGAVAYEFNDASRGLLESLGFIQEGRIRKARFIDGEYVDTIQYGLLRSEWYDD